MQKLLAVFQSLLFQVGYKALVFQGCPTVAETSGLRDPQNALQIAQTSRTFLAVWLQAKGRFLKADVAFVLLDSLGVEKSLWIDTVSEFVVELFEKRRAASKQPGFDQCCFHGQIVFCFDKAFLKRADTVADF